MKDHRVNERLKIELADVSFTSLKKRNLSRNIKVALIESSRHQKGVFKQKLVNFWNGTTEIPVSIGVVALILLLIGAGFIANIFWVDKTEARMIFQNQIEEPSKGEIGYDS